MRVAGGSSGAPGSPVGTSTQRVEEARHTVTRTKVTPGPGNELRQGGDAPVKGSLADRLKPAQHGELMPARPPYEGSNVLRIGMTSIVFALCLLTIGGAILVLLLWQQNRASGVLSSQVDRTWELFDMLRVIERWLAFAAIPVATGWIGLATVNATRATGKRRSAIAAAASLPVAVFGVWLIGSQMVLGSDDWVRQAAGFVLQTVFLAIPLLALERVADVAEARRRPLRITFVIAVVFLAELQFLGAMSTVDQATEPDQWGKLGALLVIDGLTQVLGALSVNEAARAIEEGSEHRFHLRQRFGESLLAEAHLA